MQGTAGSSTGVVGADSGDTDGNDDPMPTPPPAASSSSSGPSPGPDTGDDTGTDESTGEGSSSDGRLPLCEDPTWWSRWWRHRTRVTIDSRGVTDALGNFPMLVRLNDERVDYSETQDTGADIRIVSEDGKLVLSHEIELWDESGSSDLWVRFPEVPAEGSPSPVFYIYFGNDTAPNTSAPAEVWSNAYTSVHHMGTMVDSTLTGHDGQPNGGVASGPGLVGLTSIFDGDNDFIAVPSESDYDYTDDMTLETLIRVDAFDTSFQAIVTKGDSAWRLHRDNNSDYAAFANTNRIIGTDSTVAETSINTGAWHTVAMSLGNNRKRVFIDGVLIQDESFNASMATSSDLVMFGENAQATQRYFEGAIDEVRLSPARRSANWLRTSHRAMRDLGMLQYEPPTSCP